MNLLQYTFFQHALLGSLLASIACGIIGTYIVTRRLVFISGGITHASFGGIGLGLFAGISHIKHLDKVRVLLEIALMLLNVKAGTIQFPIISSAFFRQVHLTNPSQFLQLFLDRHI